MCAPSVIQCALAGLSRRDAIHVAAGMVAGAMVYANGGGASGQQLAKRNIGADNVLDLTHTLSPTFPIWPGPNNVPIKVTNVSTVAKNGSFANTWSLHEHHGTHLDAPAHFAAKGMTAEKIEAAALVVPAVVIDIRERAKKDADCTATIDDIKAWEKTHGKLPKNCGVFLNSGWDAKAGDSKSFSAGRCEGLHFGSSNACEFLLAARVAGLAVDTLSIDFGATKDFEVHSSGSRGRWALERGDLLAPPVGATVLGGCGAREADAGAGGVGLEAKIIGSAVVGRGTSHSKKGFITSTPYLEAIENGR